MKPIWYPLFMSIPLIIAAYVAWRAWPWWDDHGFDRYFTMWMPVVIAVLVIAVGLLAAAGLAAGLTSVISDHIDQVWHPCWTGKMVAMRSFDGVQGSIAGGIFLVQGSIGSAQMYSYYTLNNDGSYKPGKWTVDSDVAIYEEDRKDGEIRQFDELFSGSRNWLMWFAVPGDRLRMEFHIPKGSLKKQFSIE